MFRRNEGELVQSLLLDVNRELAPFTRERLIPRRSGGDAIYTLYFRSPARLARNLHFIIRHYCTVQGDTLTTAGYQYAFQDTDGKEILAYHWHPASAITEPHLHIGAGAQAARQELVRVHVPTGPIGWPELLWLLRELTAVQNR